MQLYSRGKHLRNHHALSCSFVGCLVRHVQELVLHVETSTPSGYAGKESLLRRGFEYEGIVSLSLAPTRRAGSCVSTLAHHGGENPSASRKCLLRGSKNVKAEMASASDRPAGCED